MAEQSRRPQAMVEFFKLGVLAAATIGLAGCQIIPRQPRPVPPPMEIPPVAEPERPPVAVPPTLPPDKTRNRVAVLVPTSGPNAAVGQSIANAANLALLDTGGNSIRITVYDTARGAQAAANEALADGNGLFLGPLLAEDVRAVAPVARARGVPVLAFSNDVSVAGQGVYIMGFNPAQSIDRVVDHARGRGIQRFGALVPDGVYGRRAGQAMMEAVQRSGGRMVGMQTFDRSAGGMRAAIERLSGQGQYDAVLIADGGRIAIAAAPMIRNGPSAEARILGTELWATDADLGGAAALRGAWYAAASDTMFNQLRTRYRARYGSNPLRLSSLGYDAVLLAVRIGQDWRIGAPFPQRALHDRTGFVGVDGAFRFSPDGLVERALEVKEVTASGTTAVSPAPRSFN